MAKAACPSCRMAFPVDTENINYRVDCPHCGNQFVLSPDLIIKNVPRRAVEAEVAKQGGFDTLGFVLGLLFSIVGVMIAAGVGGRRGCVSSLWGLLVGSIIGGIVAVML